MAQFVNKYMAAIVILVTIFAYAVNNSFTSWVGNENVLGGNINTTHLFMVVMFLDIIKIIIIPIAIGLIVNRFWKQFAQSIKDILPLISCIAIGLIVGFVIDANREKLFANGIMIIFVVMLHNCFGYLLGFLIGKLVKMTPAKRNAIAIEVGMPNSGMATTLAACCFPTLALATVPGAIFNAWLIFLVRLPQTEWLVHRKKKKLYTKNSKHIFLFHLYQNIKIVNSKTTTVT